MVASGCDADEKGRDGYDNGHPQPTADDTNTPKKGNNQRKEKGEGE